MDNFQSAAAVSSARLASPCRQRTSPSSRPRRRGKARRRLARVRRRPVPPTRRPSTRRGACWASFAAGATTERIVPAPAPAAAAPQRVARRPRSGARASSACSVARATMRPRAPPRRPMRRLSARPRTRVMALQTRSNWWVPPARAGRPPPPPPPPSRMQVHHPHPHPWRPTMPRGPTVAAVSCPSSAVTASRATSS